MIGLSIAHPSRGISLEEENEYLKKWLRAAMEREGEMIKLLMELTEEAFRRAGRPRRAE